jgi:hypothetical protein
VAKTKAPNGEPSHEAIVGKHPQPPGKVHHVKDDDGAIIGARSWPDTPGRVAKDATHLAGMETAAAKPTKVAAKIELPELDIRLIEVTVVGDSELIVHRWSEKAIRMMLDRQMGVASAGKEPKDPEQDYHDSLYPFPGGGYGFPTISFKNAAVSACTSLGKSITKVAARQAFHLVGELAKIDGVPRMREDMVRVGMGTADIRYRGGFPKWRVTLTIRYNARVLTEGQVTNLFNTAGFAVGVGEWRSERDGSFGLFHVARDGE